MKALPTPLRADWRARLPYIRSPCGTNAGETERRGGSFHGIFTSHSVQPKTRAFAYAHTRMRKHTDVQTDAGHSRIQRPRVPGERSTNNI